MEIELQHVDLHAYDRVDGDYELVEDAIREFCR